MEKTWHTCWCAGPSPMFSRLDEEQRMPDGTIKTVTDRGFGFIEPDKGRDDVFFHRSALVDVSIEQLHQGDRVTFIVADHARGKGLSASDVRVANV